MASTESAYAQPTIAAADQVESQIGMIWNSLKKDRLAVVSGVGLLVVTLLALLAPWLGLNDPTELRPELRLTLPGTGEYLLGGDELGRDILSRLIWGGRISLQVAVTPVLLSVIIGSGLGLVAGYSGGLVDDIIMRSLDILLAFPSILLALGIAAALGPGIGNMVLAITVVAVPALARIIRSSVLSVRELDFVMAAKAAGATPRQIIVEQILPNVVAPVIVYSTLETGRVVILAATLSFLGLGVQPPTPDWGSMLEGGRQVLDVAPHVATLPGLVIFFVTLAFNLLGDGFRDALDPRLKL